MVSVPLVLVGCAEAPWLHGSQTARQKAVPGASWLVTVVVVPVNVTVALEVHVFKLAEVWSWYGTPACPASWMINWPPGRITG